MLDSFFPDSVVEELVFGSTLGLVLSGKDVCVAFETFVALLAHNVRVRLGAGIL